MKNFILLILFFVYTSMLSFAGQSPNVIIIYADDLGYGDIGCYGSVKIKTPNLDRLAAQGLRFTNAHATSATCTPSRYALMTGQYPWRRSGTGVLPGDAALVIPTDHSSLPGIFKGSGYKTAIIGKWHLGLGDAIQKNWNGNIRPGPNEVGFDYSFIFPATADRVPTVFVENGRVVGADSSDPIEVNYNVKVGNDPTCKEHPELLKMRSMPQHGHENTIVNGIGRIGYMSGGYRARWTDEEMPLTFLAKAKSFIDANKKDPFFLFYALTEPHVPRMPSTMFKGTSGLGYRGDAILQLDWTVGQIMDQLEKNGMEKNTMIIFSSDNGPVLDDGYDDGAVSQLNGHTPWGPLRGGKYSSYEAGTRVPFIVSWPGTIKPSVSGAMICQIDLMASFARILNYRLKMGDAPDSEELSGALLGRASKGRSILVKQGMNPISIIRDDWKYIEPNEGREISFLTNVELGNRKFPQLYDLKKDPGEKNNLADQYPHLVKEMDLLLNKIRKGK
jgi:arylsulfatase A-like enzyme